MYGETYILTFNYRDALLKHYALELDARPEPSNR